MKTIMFFCLFVLTTTLYADELFIGQLRYPDITITGVKDESIVFTFAGKEISKPISSVTQIVLDNSPQFNLAEKFFAQELYTKAIETYQITITPIDWQKSLLQKRQALAEWNIVYPKEKPATQLVIKCYHCRDKGLMLCDQCKFGESPNGQARCTTCQSKGRITCPKCEGNSYKKNCRECRGKGKVDGGTIQTGIMIKTIQSICRSCDGSGYADECYTCGTQTLSLRGTVKCPRCNGSGFFGKCSACEGTKKIACTHCGKLEIIKTELKPIPEQILNPIDNKYPLIELSINWESKTVLQRVDILQKIKEKYVSQEVIWQVTIKEISIEPISDQIVLITNNINIPNINAIISFPPDKNKDMLVLSKGQDVVVKAKIVSITIPDNNVLHIKLEGITISDAGDNDDDKKRRKNGDAIVAVLEKLNVDIDKQDLTTAQRDLLINNARKELDKTTLLIKAKVKDVNPNRSRSEYSADRVTLLVNDITLIGVNDKIYNLSIKGYIRDDYYGLLVDKKDIEVSDASKIKKNQIVWIRGNITFADDNSQFKYPQFKYISVDINHFRFYIVGLDVILQKDDKQNNVIQPNPDVSAIVVKTGTTEGYLGGYVSGNISVTGAGTGAEAGTVQGNNSGQW